MKSNYGQKAYTKKTSTMTPGWIGGKVIHVVLSGFCLITVNTGLTDTMV